VERLLMLTSASAIVAILESEPAATKSDERA
jgi:hypothetical protein